MGGNSGRTWLGWAGRTGHARCWNTCDRSLVDALEPAHEQTRDLVIECFSGNRVHASPRALEAAIPGCERLTVAKRCLHAACAGAAQARQPASRDIGNQASRTPVAGAAGVGKPRRGDGLERRPVGDATAESMAIPQPPLPKSMHFEQGCGTVFHDAADTGKAVVGVLDDVSECDRFRHQLVGGLAGWLEHHQGAVSGGLGGQDQGRTRQASRKNTDASASAGPIISATLTVIALNGGSHLPQVRHDQENRCLGLPSCPRWISWTMMGVSVVGAQVAQSRWTPQRAMSVWTHSEATSPFIRAIGYASHPNQARMDSTLPQVPPAHQRTGVSGLGPITISRAISPVPKILG